MRPFLKWLGNKYQCIDEIRLHLKSNARLVEPFAGSGAVFLNTNYDSYLLGEQNKDLINLYRLLAEEGDQFIDYARRYFQPKYNQEEIYYQLRERFNNSKSIRLRSALFLYLNRHGYNGLCRYNSQGIYNVPFGRYQKPYFPEEEMRYFHQKAQHAEFIHSDFRKTMSQAQDRDIVYCDPPYIPLSSSASFTSYTQKGFCYQSQQALAEMAKTLANKNICVLISNSDTPLTRELYKDADIHSFPVKRLISCKASSRKPVHEIVAIYR